MYVIYKLNKAFLFIFFLFSSCFALAQNIETNIMKLSSQKEIDSVWNAIYVADQSYRRIKTNDFIDNLNFKKSILMIKHHGYPKGNITPNVVFTHQRSNYICEYYFPLFLKAYENGNANEDWFMHNVKRLYRGRYNRDLIEHPTRDSFKIVTNKLIQYIGHPIDYSIEKFDSLFNSYLNDLSCIISSKVIGKWETLLKNNTTYFLIVYDVNGKLYLQKRYDRDVILPQEVIYDNTTKTYTYRKDNCNMAFKIDLNGNILQSKNGNIQVTFTPSNK